MEVYLTRPPPCLDWIAVDAYGSTETQFTFTVYLLEFAFTFHPFTLSLFTLHLPMSTLIHAKRLEYAMTLGPLPGRVCRDHQPTPQFQTAREHRKGAHLRQNVSTTQQQSNKATKQCTQTTNKSSAYHTITSLPSSHRVCSHHTPPLFSNRRMPKVPRFRAFALSRCRALAMSQQRSNAAMQQTNKHAAQFPKCAKSPKSTGIVF